MIDVDQVRKTTPEELRKYCLFDIDGDRGYAIHIDVVAELLTRERIGHVAKFAQIHQDFIDLLKHLIPVQTLPPYRPVWTPPLKN